MKAEEKGRAFLVFNLDYLLTLGSLPDARVSPISSAISRHIKQTLRAPELADSQGPDTLSSLGYTQHHFRGLANRRPRPPQDTLEDKTARQPKRELRLPGEAERGKT